MARYQAVDTPPQKEAAPPGYAGIRLFIADDHPLILESIKGVFNLHDNTIDVVCFTKLCDLERALDDGGIPPNLILIDFNMPGLASLEAISGFMARHPTSRIAVISGHVDSQLARDVIRRGCLGFVPKSLAPAAVYHAIRLMSSGGRFLPDFLVESFTPATEDAPPAALPDRQKHGLTRREIEVLRALASGQTNKQIARELAIEEVTVKLHLRRSYAKLNVRNRIEAVRAVFDGALG